MKYRSPDNYCGKYLLKRSWVAQSSVSYGIGDLLNVYGMSREDSCEVSLIWGGGDMVILCSHPIQPSPLLRNGTSLPSLVATLSLNPPSPIPSSTSPRNAQPLCSPAGGSEWSTVTCSTPSGCSLFSACTYVFCYTPCRSAGSSHGTRFPACFT